MEHEVTLVYTCSKNEGCSPHCEGEQVEDHSSRLGKRGLRDLWGVSEAVCLVWPYVFPLGASNLWVGCVDSTWGIVDLGRQCGISWAGGLRPSQLMHRRGLRVDVFPRPACGRVALPIQVFCLDRW